MINQENLKALLKYLNFEQQGEIFSKNFGNENVYLKVDFEKQLLIYPEDQGLKINEHQTCNFSQAENFVVFECVHRLLEKGYHPKHIELEPKWKLGHGASGGRADILVKDEQEVAMLLIECKTAGQEYDKEKKKMETHGGQLFSYLVQERKTKYLCLYSSEFSNGSLSYQNAIVKIEDRKEDLAAFENGDESIKLYQHAGNKEELFAAWKETYNLYFHYNGIFEYDVNAYQIELKPLKKKDLKPFVEATGMFNIFMEILRHNNISDNANAFNRILSLLLCKIVDEEKSDDEILDFQVKEGEDTPERIQDRLQKLYAQGMKEHLDETIVYFEDSVIKEIIKKYPKQTPIEKVEDIFKQIKYYTNNEFAIKEVHNQNLFLQNARVINEIIRMLQNYRFRYNKKQQILGDFFELILNHGVKQSEGQFFTPVPVVRFIILSIGLDRIANQEIDREEKSFLPKILDYACGSGHFLTESIEELQKYIEKLDASKIDKSIASQVGRYQESTEWAREYIYGIEKDYRLARTSQIACFLNGDGDANIIFGDGLEDHPRLALKNKFDVIIANPPYAIKSFKNYLNVGGKNFTLFKDLKESSKEIETLFVERTAQLLKTGGKAGIILPSSILSNDGNLHQNTRTLLLENFLIKGISELGSQTFGATGTNTVVLFLEKRSDDFKKDRWYIADDLFNDISRNQRLEHINSEALLKKYIQHRQINPVDYKSLIQGNPNENIQKTELWKEYSDWFDDLTEIKKLKKSKTFQDLPQEEQNQELDKRLHQKILNIEKEKFYHFMLTLNDTHQSQQVVISKSGEKDTAKNFLGYEFSNRKGNEGIQINRNEKGHIQSKLFNEEDHTDPRKANSYFLKNFWNQPIKEIDENLTEHLNLTTLTDMLDFSRKDFNKAFSLTPQKNTTIDTKWEMVKIQSILEKIKGKITKIPKDEILISGKFPVVSQESDKLISGYSNSKETITDLPLIVFGDHTCTVKYIDFEFLRGADGTQLLKPNSKFIAKYFYYVIQLIKITNKNKYERHMKYLNSSKIPLPPKEVQKQIVIECEAIDQKSEQARSTIDQAKKEIEEKVNSATGNSIKLKELVEINPSKSEIKNLKADTVISFVEMASVSNDGYIVEMKNKRYEEVKKGSYTYFSENDIILAKITPCMENGKCALAKNLTNGLAVGSSEFHVIRVSKKLNNKYVFLFLNRDIVRREAVKKMTGSSGHRRVPKSFYENLQILAPPLAEQKKLVAKVEKLEDKIKQSQTTLNQANEQKQQILDKYLK